MTDDGRPRQALRRGYRHLGLGQQRPGGYPGRDMACCEDVPTLGALAAVPIRHELKIRVVNMESDEQWNRYTDLSVTAPLLLAPQIRATPYHCQAQVTYVRQLIDRDGRSVKETAEILGVHRSTLYRALSNI